MRDKENIALTEVFSGSTRIAKKVGANAAIVHARIAYYINENKKKKHNFFEGHYWTYLSYEDISYHLGFLSPKAVRTAINKLKENNLIIIGHFNAMAADHTNWYTIDERIFNQAYPHIN